MPINAKQFKHRLTNSSLAFCGYGEDNLGRSADLLAHPVFGPTVQRYLDDASQVCSDVTGLKTNLVAHVQEHRERSLDTYHEAVAIIIAIQMAQLRLLDEHFGIDYRETKLAYGFSLGEIGAVVAGGVLEMDEALRIPLSLAADCVALAEGVTLGVLFSRKDALPLDQVQRLCKRVNKLGHGGVGVSAYLTPNSLLILGQGDTLDRFADQSHDVLPKSTHLRKTPGHWPPLHTPIMWERAVSNRACLMLNTLDARATPLRPPVFSLVTGSRSYNDYNASDILCKWVDHPQLLWPAIEETFAVGIQTVVHIGPAPIVFPATFRRITESVQSQTRKSLGMRILANVACQRWVKPMLPRNTKVLCAPSIEQIILEDWLLEQPVGQVSKLPAVTAPIARPEST